MRSIIRQTNAASAEEERGSSLPATDNKQFGCRGLCFADHMWHVNGLEVHSSVAAQQPVIKHAPHQ